MSNAVDALKPRKAPVQARSAVTIEALHVAAIQVLTQEGLRSCTTTRIAERAGISVGSLYQYYPNRDALLAAVLEKHLDSFAGAIERACTENRGKPISQMASALVTALLAAKLRDPDESKALYAVAGERGGATLAARTSARIVSTVAMLLASAPNVHFDDPGITSAIAFSALMGPVRALLEGQAQVGFEACLKEQLVLLLTAFLQAHHVGPERPQYAGDRRPSPSFADAPGADTFRPPPSLP